MNWPARPLNVARPGVPGVLMVTGIFPPDHGGPASYVPRMAAALTARGHSVEVICLSDRLDHDDSAYSFKVRRIRRGLFWPFRIVATTFAIWQAARRNAMVFVNGLGSESALAAALAGRAAIHKIVGDYAWERAVGRGWYSGTIDQYQTAPKSVALRFLDFIRTFPIRGARRVIVPSRYLRGIVAGWQIDPGKITVTYNAAPPESTSSEAPPPFAAWPGRTLLTVCRLVPWKGVNAILRCLPHLPDTRLVVVGDGPKRRELGALADSLGVAERVIFSGHLSAAEVRHCLRQADAFVLNSTYEGLPHVVLEAMAAGVPVIATDAGGTREVVENETTGLLIPVGDDAALQAAIERLWRDPALGRALAAAAAERITAQFDFDGMVTATAATLRAAIAPAPGLPSLTLEETR